MIQFKVCRPNRLVEANIHMVRKDMCKLKKNLKLKNILSKKKQTMQHIISNQLKKQLPVLTIEKPMKD